MSDEFNEMDEIINDFVVEAEELLEQLDQDLVELENNPEDLELLNNVFRCAHTIKGTSSFLNFTIMAELTHHAEDVLNKLRRGEIKLNPSIMDVVLEAFDTIKQILNDIKQYHKEQDKDIKGIVNRLSQILETGSVIDAEEHPEIDEKETAEELDDDETPAEVEEDLIEIINDFLTEAFELISQIEENVVELEKVKEDKELLNQIFRAAHTVKGTSGFLGYYKTMELTHAVEDVLNKLRHGEIEPTEQITDNILAAIDSIRKLLTDIKTLYKERKRDIDPLVANLRALVEGKELPEEKKEEPKAAKKQESNTKKETAAVKTAAAKPKETKTAEVKPKETKQTPVKKSTDDSAAKTSRSIPKEQQTIRVDVDKLDILMNLVGELVLSKNRLNQLAKDFENEYEGTDMIDHLTETSNSIQLISEELQLTVMKTRMVPIGKVFNKFPRMVRDLSRAKDKKINLIIEGADTELDKSLVEKISDPLVHLIRNGADHGIESPAEREENGKDPTGTINLRAYRQGNHIVIEVQDDGKGMDKDAIVRKALEKNLVTESELKNMSDRDVYDMVFLPGFSTAKVVSDISGRGVGMDVVKTNIEKLNGIIEIDSEVNKGTVISIKIPITLAIMESLLAKVSNEIYAISIVSVIETLKINVKDIYSVEGSEMYRWRDSVLSLIRLQEIYDLPKKDEKNEVYVIIVGLAEKRVGLIVDYLIRKEEIVIKSMGDLLANIEGIGGATILGDGSVCLIVDVADLFKMALKWSKAKKNMRSVK